jgi:hypothetical protein
MIRMNPATFCLSSVPWSSEKGDHEVAFFHRHVAVLHCLKLSTSVQAVEKMNSRCDTTSHCFLYCVLVVSTLLRCIGRRHHRRALRRASSLIARRIRAGGYQTGYQD